MLLISLILALYPFSLPIIPVEFGVAYSRVAGIKYRNHPQTSLQLISGPREAKISLIRDSFPAYRLQPTPTMISLSIGVTVLSRRSHPREEEKRRRVYNAHLTTSISKYINNGH
jgi:hypothetical protein